MIRLLAPEQRRTARVTLRSVEPAGWLLHGQSPCMGARQVARRTRRKAFDACRRTGVHKQGQDVSANVQ